jgi:AraC-like DNA-binding protein
MRYREFTPPATLQPFVECLWTISSEGRLAPEGTGIILPDGAVELVLSFADPVRRTGSDSCNRAIDRMLVGQMFAQSRVEYTGKVDVLGVRFRPAGASVFLSVPLHELTGKVLPLGDVVDALERRITSRLDPSGTVAERITAVELILIDLMSKAIGPDPAVEAAVRAIEKSQGQLQVSSLVDDLGLSRRQLERKFLHVVGIPPKLLCRIVRFRRVCQALDHPEAQDWAGIAVMCGYYDQAHLIRDFREFSNTTPARFLSQRHEVPDV